jgi:MraZ protein
MLIGEVTYKVGQKHRLALPKQFRDELGSDLIVTRGFEGCLVLVRTDRWRELMTDVETGSFLDVHSRESARFLFGGAARVTLDSQGRFILPDALFAHAGLQDEVVFVGVGNWLEVWSADRWAVQLQQLAENGSAMAQRLVSGSNVS